MVYFCNLFKEYCIMDTITLGDKTFEKYISAQEIDNAIEKIALQINKDYEEIGRAHV